MALSYGDVPPPDKSLSVLITDPALESLALYHRRSEINARRIASIVDSLKRAELTGRVLQLTSARRAIWQLEVDAENCVYVTVGHGTEGIQARIAFFGRPIAEGSESYKELLILAGEAPYYELPDEIRLEASSDAHCPPYPERTLVTGRGLERYLVPTDEDLLLEIGRESAEADDLNGRPFRVFSGEVRAAVDLPVVLNPQQSEMLTRPRPMFLQGVAGSGKTTVLTHFAMREILRSNNRAQVLIVAYTESLKYFITRLLGALNLLEPFDESRAHVITWHELCAQLAAAAGMDPIVWAEAGHFSNFARGAILRDCRTAGSVDYVPDLEELIRVTIRGDSDSGQSFIDRSQFMGMPPTLLDPYFPRKRVYEIASQYTYILRSQKLYDDLEAARVLFEYREHLPRYDYVLVDETQDYTLPQLRLMAALAKTPAGLFYAGDMNQVVYQSQFNWEKVRTAAYQVWKTPPPETQVLRYNYRNPQPVSRIANTLMDMRSARLEIKAQESARSNQANTPMPIRVRVRRGEAAKIVRELAVQVGSLGVIGDAEHHLDIEGIEFQRTFTPRTVKGLEFNVVCLVGFNTRYRDLAVRSKRPLTPRQMFLKFSEAYVSTTRVRGQLLLIDEEVECNGLWDSAELRDLMIGLNTAAELVELVTARYRLVHPDEWRMTALDFESQHAWASAGECWERAGVQERAAAAYEKASQLKKAQALYKSIGAWGDAARIADRLEDFSEAARLYATDQQWLRSAECWSRAQNHANAAATYQKVAEASNETDMWLAAARHYVLSRNHASAATCLEHAASWLDAAEQWLAAHELLEASRCYESAGKLKQAHECQARHHESAGDFIRAATLWETIPNHKSAAICWEKAGDLEAAQKAVRQTGNHRESARLLVALGRYAEAAIDYEHLGERNLAAECHEKALNWDAAGDGWVAAGALRRAALCHEKAGSWEKAADLWKRESKHRKAAEAYQLAGRYAAAAQQWIAAGDLRRAAENYERAEEWNAAMQQWRRAGSHEDAYRCMGILLGESSRVPLKSPPTPADWPYRIPDDPDNREFAGLVATSRLLQVPSIVTACDEIERIMGARSSDPSDEIMAQCRKILRAAVDQAAEVVLSADPFAGSVALQESPDSFACLFEFASRYDVAVRLWERAGDLGGRARCYKHLGQIELARRMCLLADTSEDRASHLQDIGLFAEAALVWTDAGAYLKASRMLDLCGQGELATAAKAIYFDDDVETLAADDGGTVGHTMTKEEFRAAVDAVANPKPAATREGLMIRMWRSIVSFMRLLQQRVALLVRPGTH